VTIVEAGDPVLRRRADPVAVTVIGSPEITELIDAMAAALAEVPGVGLAAPQIGVALRVVLVQDPAELQAGVAPEILAERERVGID
jgi:peptide deformylase